MRQTEAIELTKRWIAEFVIGLNLCPFARRVFDADRIRYVVSNATCGEELGFELKEEIRSLVNTPRAEIETTLVILTHLFSAFLDFNDYLETANRILITEGFEGTIQIASFHPRYQFAGTDAEDVENFTNRSPFPMIHLLREASISEVANDTAFLDGIPTRNIELLRRIGRVEMDRRLRGMTQDDNSP
jgi:hypothetical protein